MAATILEPKPESYDRFVSLGLFSKFKYLLKQCHAKLYEKDPFSEATLMCRSTLIQGITQ